MQGMLGMCASILECPRNDVFRTVPLSHLVALLCRIYERTTPLMVASDRNKHSVNLCKLLTRWHAGLGNKKSAT